MNPVKEQNLHLNNEKKSQNKFVKFLRNCDRFFSTSSVGVVVIVVFVCFKRISKALQMECRMFREKMNNAAGINFRDKIPKELKVNTP